MRAQIQTRVLVIVLFFQPTLLLARDWNTSTGQVTGSLEGTNITVQTPSGERILIPFAELSETDKEYVLKELGGRISGGNQVISDDAEGAFDDLISKLKHEVRAGGSRQSIGHLVAAIGNAATDSSKIDAVTQSLLNDVSDLISVAVGLELASEFEGGANLSIDLLLALERQLGENMLVRLEQQKTQQYPLSFNFRFVRSDEYSQFMNLHVRPFRNLMTVLSSLRDHEQRVDHLLRQRTKELQTAPKPGARRRAALCLAGATQLAPSAEELLISTMKNDVSEDVRLDAGFALGGFDGNNYGIANALVSRCELSGGHPIFVAALLESRPDSPALRRYVRSLLSNPRIQGPHGSSVEIACTILHQNGQDNSWAIPALLAQCRDEIARYEGTVNHGTTPDLEILIETLLKFGGTDRRVLRYFERQAQEPPETIRVTFDTIAKKIAANIEATQ